VPTTVTPNISDSFSKSIEIPFFCASSRRLTQTITLGVSSKI